LFVRFLVVIYVLLGGDCREEIVALLLGYSDKVPNATGKLPTYLDPISESMQKNRRAVGCHAKVICCFAVGSSSMFCASDFMGGSSVSLLPEDKKELLKQDFEQKLVAPVQLVVFTQETECRFCSDTRTLVQELATLSPKLGVDVYDFVADAQKAKEYGVDKIPAIAVIGKLDYGVRLYGIPYGYELNTLIEAIVNVSKGVTDLADKTKEVLKDIKNPVHIQVFVSLTCPHCPAAAAIAHKLAIENPNIRSDVIDAQEFPQLTQKYNVIGVPKIVLNEKVEFMGAFSEDLFAEHALLAAYPP
jgi:glutaredoxin-like protein